MSSLSQASPQALMSYLLNKLGLTDVASSKTRAGSRSSLLPSSSTPPSPSRKQHQQQQLYFTRRWRTTFYYTASIALWYCCLSWLEFLPPPAVLLDYANGYGGKDGQMNIAWASQERINMTLPKPFDDYRWTLLHANVMELQNGTRRTLEMLTYLEEVPPKRQPGWWQLTVPDIPKIIDHTTCLFNVNGRIRASLATMEFTFPRAPFDSTKANWALLITCELPSEMEIPSTWNSPSIRRGRNPPPIDVELDLTLANRRVVFSQKVKLLPHRIPVVQKGSLGICVAPMYGPIDDLRVLEWRIHHALLGVKAVHWYDRTGHQSTHEWVKVLSKEMGLQDTWTDAPCISPETCGTDILEAKGVSGDQVLYYADCLARSRHTHPTEWLAMIDVDEFLIPGNQHNTSIVNETLAQLDTTVAMLALNRFQTPATTSASLASSKAGLDPELRSGSKQPTFQSPPLILDGIKTLLTPQEIDRHDNGKILYRASALKLAWIHWEVAFRNDQPAHQKWKFDTLDKHPFGLVHVSDSKGVKPFNMSVDIPKRLDEHIQSVASIIRKVAVNLPWLVTQMGYLDR